MSEVRNEKSELREKGKVWTEIERCSFSSSLLDKSTHEVQSAIEKRRTSQSQGTRKSLE